MTLSVPRAAGALAALALALPAAAQQTGYADRATFLGALAASPTTLTFDGITDGTVPAPSTIGGVGFGSDAGSSLMVLGYANPYVMLSTWPNLIVHANGAGAEVRATFAGATTAFGLAYGYGFAMDVPQQVTLTLWNGATPIFTQTLSDPTATYAGRFFGVTSTTAFTAATVSASRDFLVDDVTIGPLATAATTAPEPGVLPLVATGLLLVGGATWRRRSA
jgi:hypothetical protein